MWLKEILIGIGIVLAFPFGMVRFIWRMAGEWADLIGE